MPCQVAVVRVRYVEGVATGFTVPVVITKDTLDEAAESAMAYIRKHLVVPKDVANRTELLAVEVLDKEFQGILEPCDERAHT